jgi:type VI secretion system Vgr family protein
MGEYTQANRMIRVETVLGKDALLLQGFRGQEGVSRLFHFDLYMHSENRAIAMDSIVGKKATVVVVLPDQKERYINGVISSFAQAGSTPLEMGTNPKIFAHYSATLVPWMWMLTRTSDCRIFQDMTVPDIIARIFQEHKLDFKNRLHGTFKPREYCVQYRETDFNFVSRLMEEEGIFYFFEHAPDQHTLVMADDPSEFKPTPLQTDVSYKSLIGEQRHEDVVSEWTIGQEVRPGRYAINDFNFKQPLLDLTSGVGGKDERKLEIYDYPGEYVSRDEGERLVGIRMHEQESPQIVAHGASTCRGFMAGYKFKLKDHYRKDFNKEYVITSSYISSDQGHELGRDHGSRGGRIFRVFESNPVHPLPGAVPPGAHHAGAVYAGAADGGGRRPARRRDLHRPVWAREGAIPLGPRRQVQRKKFLLDARVAELGGQALGRDLHAEGRPGGHRRFSGGQSRSTHHHRTCL